MRVIPVLTVAAVLVQLGCGSEPTDQGAAASKLAFSVQPTDAVAGTSLAPVTVTVQDAAGNAVADAPTDVTLVLGGNAASATLSGTLTRSTVSGVASFDDLSVSQAGTAFTLTASATNLTPATSTPFDVTAPALTPNATHVLVTDDPFPYDRVARVDLYFVSISGSLSPDTGSAGQFVTLATPNRRINLLALQQGITDEVGALALPTGIITAVRVIIDTDSSSITLKDGRVLTSTSSPGIDWQSSAGRPVLNALVHEQIEVPDSGGVVVIVYDVGEAFIPPQVTDPTSTDSGFIFSPVLRAADGTRTGSVAGTVRATSADGAPVQDASLQLYLGDPTAPENTWSRMATARTDATGAFRFAFVTPSAHWAGIPARASDTYIVTADPPAGAGLGRAVLPNVQVVAGAETAIGTLILP